MEDEQITRLLAEADRGDAAALRELYPLVYDELRRLAQHQLAEERPEHTLQATALVNEAYLRLVDQTRARWQDRGHFFAIAAQAIRRILVDYARTRGRQKRGGDWQRIPLTEITQLPQVSEGAEMLALDDALRKLAAEDAAKAQLVELRFFAGLTHEEIAGLMGLSTRTVERHWRFAKAWLYRELSGAPAD